MTRVPSTKSFPAGKSLTSPPTPPFPWDSFDWLLHDQHDSPWQKSSNQQGGPWHESWKQSDPPSKPLSLHSLPLPLSQDSFGWLLYNQQDGPRQESQIQCVPLGKTPHKQFQGISKTSYTCTHFYSLRQLLRIFQIFFYIFLTSKKTTHPLHYPKWCKSLPRWNCFYLSQLKEP